MRRAVSLVAAACALLIPIAPAPAHSTLSGAVEHRNTAAITSDNIDVTTELIFSGMPSLMHRRRMDGDGDGIIRDDEIKAYLADVGHELSGRLTLQIDGAEPIPMTPLFDPEVDLGGLKAAVPGRYVLRLFHFVPAPDTLRAGSRLIINDRLFDDLPSRTTYRIIADQGVAVRIEQADGFTLQPEQARAITLRCTAVRGRGNGDPSPARTLSAAAPAGRRNWTGGASALVLAAITFWLMQRFTRVRTPQQQE